MVAIKSREILKQIMKSPGSVLEADRYVAEIKFSPNGVAFLDGIIWPKAFKEINTTPGSDEGETKFLSAIAAGVSTSTDKDVIAEDLTISQTSAERVLDLVFKHQLEDYSNGFQLNSPFPSLTNLRRSSPARENFSSTRTFVKIIRNLLSNLSSDDIRTLTTRQFLHIVKKNYFKVHGVENESTWKVSLSGVRINFLLEDSLERICAFFNDAIFCALYHFCISCASEEEIILKRDRLLDCFVFPYNDTLLKAAEARILVQPIYGTEELTKSKNLYFTFYEEDSEAIIGHSKLPLVEVLSLMDPRKVEIISSNPMVFVNSKPGGSLMFRKVKQRTETCYTYQEGGETSYFEMILTRVQKYSMRLNSPYILLSEFCCYYDLLSREESQRLFRQFKDNIDKIEETSDELYNVTNQEKMKELILCENGDVFKRKKPRILNYFKVEDEDSFEYRFSKVLLFYHFKTVQDLNEELVEQLFSETHNVTGDRIVDLNEKQFYESFRGL